MADLENQRSLSGLWVLGNNQLVDEWKRHGVHAFCGGADPSRLTPPCAQFHQLLRKIKGVPASLGGAGVELTVLYNACVFSIAQLRAAEAQSLLTEGLERALAVVGGPSGPPSDVCSLWRWALRALADGPLLLCSLRLLCLQWALWLSSHRLTHIQDLKDELSSLSDRLSALEEEEEAAEEERKRSLSPYPHTETPRLVADPPRLKELLDVCTVVARGAQQLTDGRPFEALSELQRAFSLPSPRHLLAHAHQLSGRCLAATGRPQMALLCFMKAVETDPRCEAALHRSTLLYRLLGNAAAEVEALRLLSAALGLPPAPAPDVNAEVSPLHASVLLSSPVWRGLLSVPSAPSVQHRLARACLLHGRVAEGVEHYLDLLAALHSDPPVPPQVHPHLVRASPRVAELYLEAAAALLLAGRGPDCWALCDEVLGSTRDLLPERLTLEEPARDPTGDPTEDPTEDPDGPDRDQDPLDVVLWAGSAHLLQAHCQAHLKDWRQAVTSYTRCINLTGKVCFKTQGFQTRTQTPAVDPAGRPGSRLCSLQRLKGLSLAGRGISFTQRDQLREALRDLQLSSLVSPGGVSAALWLGEVLWRLERRGEAASCWEKGLAAGTPANTLPLYLQEPRSSPSLDPSVLRSRVQSLRPT